VGRLVYEASSPSASLKIFSASRSIDGVLSWIQTLHCLLDMDIANVVSTRLPMDMDILLFEFGDDGFFN
jgi:hypothetical protein